MVAKKEKSEKIADEKIDDVPNVLVPAATDKHNAPVMSATYNRWKQYFIYCVIRRKTRLQTAAHFGVSEATISKAVLFFEDQSDQARNFDDAVTALKFIIGELWEYYDTLGRGVSEVITKRSKLVPGKDQAENVKFTVVDTTTREGVPHALRIKVLSEISTNEKNLQVLLGLTNQDLDQVQEIKLTHIEIKQKRIEINQKIQLIQGANLAGHGLPSAKTTE